MIIIIVTVLALTILLVVFVVVLAVDESIVLIFVLVVVFQLQGLMVLINRRSVWINGSIILLRLHFVLYWQFCWFVEYVWMVGIIFDIIGDNEEFIFVWILCRWIIRLLNLDIVMLWHWIVDWLIDDVIFVFDVVLYCYVMLCYVFVLCFCIVF